MEPDWPQGLTITMFDCLTSQAWTGACSLFIVDGPNAVVHGCVHFQRSHRSFKTFAPKEDHVVVAISFSPSGDRFLVATGSAQPMVFDRDGNRLATFTKGDPYIMDMYHTHGHNALVTGAQWHPSNPNVRS